MRKVMMLAAMLAMMMVAAAPAMAQGNATTTTGDAFADSSTTTTTTTITTNVCTGFTQGQSVGGDLIIGAGGANSVVNQCSGAVVVSGFGTTGFSSFGTGFFWF